MNLKVFLSVLAISATTQQANCSFSEPVVWTLSLPSQISSGWEFLQVFQINSEVVLTIFPNDFPIPPFTEKTSAVYFIGAPSFFVTEVKPSFRTDNIPNLIELTSNTSYNFENGDGWIDSPFFGEFYCKTYPWVYLLDEQGWYYVHAAGVTATENAYWLWSPSDGWEWTTRGAFPYRWNLQSMSWVQ